MAKRSKKINIFISFFPNALLQPLCAPAPAPIMRWWGWKGVCVHRLRARVGLISMETTGSLLAWRDVVCSNTETTLHHRNLEAWWVLKCVFSSSSRHTWNKTCCTDKQTGWIIKHTSLIKGYIETYVSASIFTLHRGLGSVLSISSQQLSPSNRHLSVTSALSFNTHTHTSI